MPNLGKVLLFAMIQLFVMKAVCTAVLPILKIDQQLLVWEESQENEESDGAFEVKFLDEYIDLNHAITAFHIVNLNSSKGAYSCYNAALFIGHKNRSFRPPCA